MFCLKIEKGNARHKLVLENVSTFEKDKYNKLCFQQKAKTIGTINHHIRRLQSEVVYHYYKAIEGNEAATLINSLEKILDGEEI